jgi:hypothetical protein
MEQVELLVTIPPCARQAYLDHPWCLSIVFAIDLSTVSQYPESGWERVEGVPLVAGLGVRHGVLLRQEGVD